LEKYSDSTLIWHIRTCKKLFFPRALVFYDKVLNWLYENTLMIIQILKFKHVKERGDTCAFEWVKNKFFFSLQMVFCWMERVKPVLLSELPVLWNQDFGPTRDSSYISYHLTIERKNERCSSMQRRKCHLIWGFPSTKIST